MKVHEENKEYEMMNYNNINHLAISIQLEIGMYIKQPSNKKTYAHHSKSVTFLGFSLTTTLSIWPFLILITLSAASASIAL